MEKRKLDKFRKTLLQKRAQILERFFKQEETQKILTEQSAEPRDVPEYALMDITQEILAQLEDIEIELLHQIDAALERIDNGTYGICRVCGKEIEEERLKALPWTDLCIEHAKEEEQIRETPDTRYREYFDNISVKENPTSPEEAGEI